MQLMKQVFIALIVTMFALNLQAQTADSTTAPTEQEAPKNLTPAQQKAYDAKMKRQKDAADRKAESEKRRQEAAAKRPGAKAAKPSVTDSAAAAPAKPETPAEKMRREAAEKRAAAAAQRKAAADERAAKRPGAKATSPTVTDSTGAAAAPAKPETPAEKMRREAAEKRAALAAQRKAAADERAAKKPGTKAATTPETGTDSSAIATEKPKKGNKKEVAPKQTPEEARKEAADKRQQALDARKAEADKRKQDIADKKAADEQLKASGVSNKKTAVKATPEEKAQAKKEADALKPTRTPGSRTAKGKNDNTPAVVTESQVAKLYYTLPLEAVPQVGKYLEEHPDVKESVDNEKTKDPMSGSMHDTRKGLINKEDGSRNYLQLGQLEKYTRMQMYTTKDAKAIMAIQTDECTPECKNNFKLYIQSADGWDDATDKMLPPLDKKYMLGKIKSAYKKQYTDNTVYDAKGYETDESVYKSAIVYTISPDEDKIIVRDQNIDLPLYSITWDQVKNKFNLVKL